MTSRGPRYPADTVGKPSSSDQPVGEQVNQIIATAWYPPAVADEAAVLRAEQEARRFLAEFTRLSNLADAQDADEELLDPIAEHRERLLDFIRSAPVTSAATAAAVLHFLLDEQVGLGAHMPDERDFAAFARVTAWAEGRAAEETPPRGRRLRNDYARPEMIQAIESAMATAWEPPTGEPDEAVLLKAEAEGHRMIKEWECLSDESQTTGDQDDIQPLLDHANRLIEYVTSAPVQSAATAATSMRFLLGGEERSPGSRGIQDMMEPTDFHFTGFGRILEWLEARAAGEKRECQP